ncbi:MAG: type II secretion system protein [Nautiliaceae bacterium]
MKNPKKYKGFTLLELIISMLVIGISLTSFPFFLQFHIKTAFDPVFNNDLLNSFVKFYEETNISKRTFYSKENNATYEFDEVRAGKVSFLRVLVEKRDFIYLENLD